MKTILAICYGNQNIQSIELWTILKVSFHYAVLKVFFTIILTDTLDSTGEAAAETSEPQNVSTERAAAHAAHGKL